MKVRVLIADDEEYCRVRLRRFLEDEPNIEIVGEQADGLSTWNAIGKLEPDIVFLDVRMPELDGFGVLEQLEGTKIPVIVFVSAFDDYALAAFDFDAADYLFKPFDRERFQRALKRALDRLTDVSLRDQAARIQALAQAARQREAKGRRLTVKSNGSFVLINPEDVDWISSADNYSELHVGKVTHLMRSTIGALAEELGGDQFVQLSRAALVNKERVTQITPKSHGDAVVKLVSGVELVATRTFRKHWLCLLQG